jgi:hypothetical protein
MSKFKELLKTVLSEGYDRDDPSDNFWNNKEIPISCTTPGKVADERWVKKNNIITKKQKNIDLLQNNLNLWLDKMSSREDISVLIIEKQRIQAQNKINKKIKELLVIKNLPLTDPMFN